MKKPYLPPTTEITATDYSHLSPIMTSDPSTDIVLGKGTEFEDEGWNSDFSPFNGWRNGYKGVLGDDGNPEGDDAAFETAKNSRTTMVF